MQFFDGVLIIPCQPALNDLQNDRGERHGYGDGGCQKRLFAKADQPVSRGQREDDKAKLPRLAKRRADFQGVMQRRSSSPCDSNQDRHLHREEKKRAADDDME